MTKSLFAFPHWMSLALLTTCIGGGIAIGRYDHRLASVEAQQKEMSIKLDPIPRIATDISWIKDELRAHRESEGVSAYAAVKPK